MDVYLGVTHRHHRRGLFSPRGHEGRQKGVGTMINLIIVMGGAAIIALGFFGWLHTPSGKKWLASL